jgi:hypothetical protein
VLKGAGGGEVFLKKNNIECHGGRRGPTNVTPVQILSSKFITMYGILGGGGY